MIHLLFRTLLVWAVPLGALALTGLARPPAALHFPLALPLAPPLAPSKEIA